MIQQILSEAVHSFTIVLILMLADLITGVAKALQKHSVKSANLRNSINKTILYFVVLIIGGCLAVAGEEGISSIFTIFICCVEGVSILENFGELFPNSKIVNSIKKILERKKEEKEN